MRKKIVFYSILALVFLILTYTIDWIFIAGAIILVVLNQKELFKTNN